MRTVEKRAQAQIVVKKSRFIATLAPARDRQEAENFVAQMKKQYWDARHNCSAYILPAKDKETPYVHSSDDGEPSGTAGKPMLSVLQGADLQGVVVVVTRYFGGVLLGTGGLVRAYQDAVSEVIGSAELLEQRNVVEINVTIDYTMWDRIQSLARQHEDMICQTPQYSENVSLSILLPSDKSKAYMEEITKATNARAVITPGEEAVVNVPVNERIKNGS